MKTNFQLTDKTIKFHLQNNYIFFDLIRLPFESLHPLNGLSYVVENKRNVNRFWYVTQTVRKGNERIFCFFIINMKRPSIVVHFRFLISALHFFSFLSITSI